MQFSASPNVEDEIFSSDRTYSLFCSLQASENTLNELNCSQIVLAMLEFHSVTQNYPHSSSTLKKGSALPKPGQKSAPDRNTDHAQST